MIGFSKKGICKDDSRADAVLLAPMVEFYGEDAERHCTESGNGYECGALVIRDSVSEIGDGRYVIKRHVENTSAELLRFKDVIRVADNFCASKYLIPCILYNGNEHGSSNTPRSYETEGQSWILSYDRMGIPSCTLTENEKTGVALFASAKDAVSLISSCSLKCENGVFEHRIYHPVTEAPYTYSSKNVMSERYDTYHTLAGGDSLDMEAYLCVLEPKYENYACASLIDAALELLSPIHDPSLSPERVKELGISFANALLYDYKGKKLIITHYAQRLFRYQHMVKITLEEMAQMMRDPYYTELGAFDERFEMGWADQNLLNARMLALDAHERGDDAALATAIGIFDAFAETQRENGLCYTLYEQNFDPDAEQNATPDVCNLGWGAAEMLRMYNFLKGIGIDKPEYARFAERVCDFMIERYNGECGYGKSYRMDGTPAQTQGSIGGFMIVAMLECYRHSGNEKYLKNAIEAHDFYYGRDLDNFVCTAGALDCASIDKETAYPFVVSSLELYDITADVRYIERAEKAAVYFTSWMFFYDVLYPTGSEFTEYGYRTTGGTAISAEHHAIDSWGSIIAPELCRLAALTGEEKWKRIARLMWANAIQGMTLDSEHIIHGVNRPVGSQNEGFFQARWTKYRPTCEERGHYNDCLSAWTGAYRMKTVNALVGTEYDDVIR